MKYLITVVVAAGLGFAASYLLVSKPNQSQSPVVNTKAQTPVAASSVKTPEIISAVVPQNSPVEILQKLAQLNPAASKRPTRTVRQIIHQLESLTEAGNSAISPISAFIVTGVDMDYPIPEKAGSGAPFWNWHPGQPILSGLVLPPSLRLSLVDVLKNIGGNDAEAALGAMLKNTSRSVEVAYISAVLEMMAPGKYAEAELTAAKKLLNAPAPGSSNPLDANPNATLYGILNAHGDNSLVDAAQAKLMSNGRLDSDAARYLVGALKGQAMPLLAKVYPDANAEDKNMINHLAFSYVGGNSDANSIFKSWILDNKQDSSSGAIVAKQRPTYIQMLAGGNFGLFQAPVPTDPAVIANRISLLNDLNSSLPESALKQVVGQTIQKLNGLSTVKKAQ